MISCFGRALLAAAVATQVMRYNDAHPDNTLSRWPARTSIAPNGSRGVSVGVSFPVR